MISNIFLYFYKNIFSFIEFLNTYYITHIILIYVLLYNLKIYFNLINSLCDFSELKNYFFNFWDKDLNYFFKNIILILKNPKKIFLFIVLIYFFSFFVFFIIVLSIFFYIYFILSALICKTINIKKVWNFNEPEIQGKSVYTDLLYLFFIFFPMVRGFILAYYTLYFFSVKKVKFFNFSVIIFILFIIIFRLYFIFIFGVSYIVILNSIYAINLFFKLKKFKYDSKSAFVQTFLLNFYAIWAYTTVLSVIPLKLTIENKIILFNPNGHKKFEKINFLQQSISQSKVDILQVYVGNEHLKKHPGGLVTLDGNNLKEDISIITNFTSVQKLPVLNKTTNIVENIQNNFKIIPNLKFENKPTYTSPLHKINTEDIRLSTLPLNFQDSLIRMRLLIWLQFLSQFNTPVLTLEGKMLVKNMNDKSLKELVDLGMYDSEKFEFLLYMGAFYESNKKLLNTIEGAHMFEKLTNSAWVEAAINQKIKIDNINEILEKFSNKNY